MGLRVMYGGCSIDVKGFDGSYIGVWCGGCGVVFTVELGHRCKGCVMVYALPAATDRGGRGDPADGARLRPRPATRALTGLTPSRCALAASAR